MNTDHGQMYLAIDAARREKKTNQNKRIFAHTSLMQWYDFDRALLTKKKNANRFVAPTVNAVILICF